MKAQKYAMLGVALLLAVAWVVIPTAAAKNIRYVPVHNPTTPAKHKAHKPITWTVTNVDTQGGFVTLKASDSSQPDKIVQVNFATKITLNGQTAALVDVATGMKATFVESAANSVTSLTLTGTPANKAAKHKGKKQAAQ